MGRCSKCSDYEFADIVGSSQCLLCPQHAWSKGTKKSMLTDCYCKRGAYTRAQSNGTTCHLCPKAQQDEEVCPPELESDDCIAATCHGGTAWPYARQGFFHVSDWVVHDGRLTGQRRQVEPILLRCEPEEACLGNNKCHERHKQGMLCQVCNDGHYRPKISSKGEPALCEPCSAEDTFAALWLVL